MNTSIYNPYVPQELFLMHHGILGQRWGKKNGPPYPLGAGDHSASEKKAGWRKSLAGGAKAVGRGSVKVAKAVGRGAVKTGKAINFVAVRTHVKPKILMSEKEMIDSINRMKLTKQYKRALHGKFINVEEAERNKGKGIVKTTMESIGANVLLPTMNGLLRYKITQALSDKTEGEKVISKNETLAGGGKTVGFRNGYFYDASGNPSKKGKSSNGDGGGEKKDTPKSDKTVSFPKQESRSKPPASYPKQTTATTESNPKQTTSSSSGLTRTQQLNARSVLGPVNKRKNSSTILKEANVSFNKSWKQGTGYTNANNTSHVNVKTAELNNLIKRYSDYSSADKIFTDMMAGKWTETDERKYRYGR